MKSKKANSSKLVVLGGVSVVAAAIGFRMISSGPQAAPAASVTDASDAPATVLPDSTPQPAPATVKVTWPTDIVRDPFSSNVVFPPAAPPTPKADPIVTPVTAPVDTAALARETIQLKGTVLGDHPLAMMNGRVLSIGDFFEGFKIVQIETKQITVERDGSRVVVEAH